jgi:CTP synthase
MIIFVTGGVMSSLGKGITASALGAQLRARGLRVRLSKFDPYLNVDPGTMSPYQHGEVFVTDDGGEVDLDFGSYERFTDVSTRKDDSTTAGKIYCEIIERERRGDYLGQTIQTIPHITDIIKRQMMLGLEDVDVKLCEIGGTVGDIEGQPFLEAIRQLRQTLGAQKTLFIHLGWVPYMASASELKTKPLQHSVRELQRCGIQPDILVCRCDRPLPQSLKDKISLFCNLPSQRVIEAMDVDNIYSAPVRYHEAGLDTQVCALLDKADIAGDLSPWRSIMSAVENPRHHITVAIVGKYVRFPDAYRSLLEALDHGGFPDHIQVKIKFVDAETFEAPSKEATNDGPNQGNATHAAAHQPKESIQAKADGQRQTTTDKNWPNPDHQSPSPLQASNQNRDQDLFDETLQGILHQTLGQVDAIVVPGGFGTRGTEGMIGAIAYARRHKIPFFGICLGMQLAVIEGVRTLSGLEQAGSLEFSQTPHPVIAPLMSWMDQGQLKSYSQLMGGTMRLGAYSCQATQGSLLAKAYGQLEISERHRHRYEVNNTYLPDLAKAGLVVTGLHRGELVEVVERTDHPWFLATQFHPELKSRPFAPHPLFLAFIRAGLRYQQSKKQPCQSLPAA